MTEPRTPHPSKRGVRIYDRLRQPGSSLVTSAGIGVVIVAVLTTLLAIVVAIIW